MENGPVVSLIAIVDKNNALGLNNQLLCHLPADLQHFKSLTWGKPIIMGMNTYRSLGKPLPGRKNIVLSRQAPSISGVSVYASLEAALQDLALEEEVMIIGGAQVYQYALALANRVYLTRIEHEFPADVFFPKLDAALWQCVSEADRAADEKNAYALKFCEFERK